MKKTVLFLCTENSARSLMAEAVLRARAGDRFDVASAGHRPGVPDASALSVLQTYGIDTEGLASKSVESLGDRHFDFVITLCDRVRQECGRWPGSGVTMEWDFPDPRQSQNPSVYKQVLDALCKRLDLFIQVNDRLVPNVMATVEPLDFFKCLADETRLSSVLLIDHAGELCVCDLMTALDEPQPKISRHLAQLRKTGLLLDRRQGQWVYYRLHPLLHDWMRAILTQTRENSMHLLKAPLMRLERGGVAACN